MRCRMVPEEGGSRSPLLVVSYVLRSDRAAPTGRARPLGWSFVDPAVRRQSGSGVGLSPG
jgi:hypothetical protein